MRANITDYGARPDGVSLCTEAFKYAIEACSLADGGVVCVPAGIYLTGPIHLKSNINLYLEPGAVIKFSKNIEDYPLVFTRWEGHEQKVYSPQIYSENCENISITGQGVLDGQGDFWWPMVKEKSLEYPRPRLISFKNCKKVLVDGITLMNSPSWTLHPLCCDNITINNITIKNPADSPNTDGINPESSKNVHISNCHIDVGDDCITLKSGVETCMEKMPCENITITNCTMMHGHGGVVIGSEMSGGVRNIAISNCIFEDTDRGIRIKSRRGRGGIVEDIRVDNLIMKRVKCPVVIHLYYFCGPGGKEKYAQDKSFYPVHAATPQFRRIHISNLTAREVGVCAGFVYGLPEMPVSELSVNNVNIELAKESEADVPAMMSDLEPMQGRGFILTNVSDMEMDQVKVQGVHGPDVTIRNCSNISLFRCRNYDRKEPLSLDLDESHGVLVD